MKRVLAIITTLICTCLAMPARGTSYYVANNGNDTNSGTSPGAPWKTVQRANLAFPSLRPGDSLLFRAGNVFRDDYLRCENFGKAPEGGRQPCFGAQDAPIVISSYGSGPKPVLEGADALKLTWINIGGGTYKGKLEGALPLKVFLDAKANPSEQLLPVPNGAGAYSSSQAYEAYDAVTSSKGLYVRGPEFVRAGTPLNNSAAWVRLDNDEPGNKSQTFRAENSGLENVRSTPGSWYANKSTIYVHLADGSDPNQHVLEGTYRKYGVLLLGARFISVIGLAIEHVSQSGILSVPFSTHTTGIQPGEHIEIVDNVIFNYGSITSDGLPLQEHSNPLQGGIVIRAGGEYNPHLIQGSLIRHNRIGIMDCYFGVRGQVYQAGIIGSGIDGGGVANHLTIQDNFVSTVNAEGIIFSTVGLYSDPAAERVLNKGGRVTGNELTNNQGNLFFTATEGGMDDHNIIHHSFGEGVQTGGHSLSNAAAPQIHSFNLIYHIGKSASGVLFNGFDCNGGFANGYWLNNTVYDTNSAAITLESGCDSAHVHNNIFEQDVLRFPERDMVNRSYLLYYSTGSAHHSTDFSNNLWIPGPNRTPFHGSADSFTCADFFVKWPDVGSSCRSGPIFRDPERGDFAPIRSALRGTTSGTPGAVADEQGSGARE